MSQNKSLVSVVIPTYNRCGYLQQAIESVLSQVYGDFEVIVVDDGSTDGTARVVAGFDDGRVRYLYQPNAGRSAARNRGIEVARGMYLAFLDDDDLYLPHKLACQVAFLESHPEIDLVSAGVRLIDEHGAVRGVWRTWLDQPQLTLMDCLYACPLPTCSVLFRRRVLGHLDHWFDPDFDLAEDTDFFLRLLLAGCRIDWLPEIVAVYRIHSNSSQWDVIKYRRAHQRLLDKFLIRPEVPDEVRAERTRLYAHHYLASACHAYACGEVALAQQDLVQAVDLDPALQEGCPSPLVVDFATFANSFRVEDPRAYLGFVFDHLPASLAHLQQRRREALSLFHMGRVFRAHAAGKCPSLKDWLWGVYYAPRWLGNRGVWSILTREMLGLHRQPDAPKYGLEVVHCESTSRR